MAAQALCCHLEQQITELVTARGDHRRDEFGSDLIDLRSSAGDRGELPSGAREFGGDGEVPSDMDDGIDAPTEQAAHALYDPFWVGGHRDDNIGAEGAGQI